ncbi:NUDIX hydrolase [Nakamurella aerolata]|uniref:NUDIX hydrolase n=1 Tax=Nakamurella aerolata TaxID=1656892 RepID=A0A849A4R3_9ACTN|nr:NUDIX hydrolase [Nakamurella aerolata]NNG35535.1 NUDIX hydrolase [Nakamurella aerolata]
MLADPDGSDPALSVRASSGPDALELNAACLALPDYARELGVAGTPLLWSWPGYTYPAGQNRRDELLHAAALLVAAVERIDMGYQAGSAGTARRRPEAGIVSATPRLPVWAGAVIVDELDRLLLVKGSDSRAWDIPGGYLSAGEDPVTGLVGR